MSLNTLLVLSFSNSSEDCGSSTTVSSEDHAQLKKMLEKRTRQVYYYRNKLEEEVEILSEECERKIKSIREFWKGKIYYEGTRSGKILKKSMQS